MSKSLIDIMNGLTEYHDIDDDAFSSSPESPKRDAMNAFNSLPTKEAKIEFMRLAVQDAEWAHIIRNYVKF
jgi:hypothetical protein